MHGPSSAFMAQTECPGFSGGKAAPVIQKRGRTAVMKLVCFTAQHDFKIRVLALLLERHCVTSGRKALTTLNKNVERKSSSAQGHKIPFDQTECVISSFNRNSLYYKL